MQITLDIDAPTDPDHTRAVADAYSESVRVLNHLTRKNGSLTHPSHLYDVVGRLEAGSAGLEQLLGQLHEWLAAEHSAGRVRDDGDRTEDQVNTCLAFLKEAADDAEHLAEKLRRAHSASASLSANSTAKEG